MQKIVGPNLSINFSALVFGCVFGPYDSLLRESYGYSALLLFKPLNCK